VSTYLQLCQDVVRECGIPGTGPSAITGQTGELARVVAWVKNAYTEIQNRYPDWRWLRKPFTFNTVAGTDAYAYGSVTDGEASALITRFSRWWANDLDRRPTIYLSSGGVTGEHWLIWVPYSFFKRLYRFGPQTTARGMPIHISVNDANKLVLGPNPDAVYVVQGEYQKNAQVLAANSDTPEIPVDYHQLIVCRAMAKYAGFESASDVMLRATTEGNPLMRQLEANQRPQMRLAGPLA
jgi:hypothetical protein